MTTYRQSGAQSTAGNPLCERLQREFRGRGVNNTQIRRESTEVMIRRVQHGLNPYENAPDPAKHTVSDVSAVRRPAAPQKPRTASAKPAVQTPRTIQTQSAAKPAAKQSAAAKTAAVDVRRERSAAAAALHAKTRTPAKEISVRQPFPLAAVTLLTMFTVMVMTLVFSLAQNYELSSEISSLQAQARQLEQTARDLEVQLEERDDIRVIENIAVNELGMVKNDLVESRFVSVSGGDRVELAAETETEAEPESAGIFSTMLSAIGENFDRLMEYFN